MLTFSAFLDIVIVSVSGSLAVMGLVYCMAKLMCRIYEVCRGRG